MDPDTQKLIERAKQRREMLNQRIAGMPEAAPRKRRTPVYDGDGSDNNVLSEKQNNQDDSPKRQCVRDVEQEVKPDTPAIRGVQSRIKDLPPSLAKENDDTKMEDAPTPKPRKSVSSPPLGRKFTSPQKSPAKDVSSSAAPSGRRGRFAALAKNINNWEDDLSHPVIHKEEEKKPRWQPPPKAENLPAQATSSRKGPAPQTPAVTAATKSAPIGSPKKTHAPPTPRNVPGSPAGNLARNSPLRSSKVEWNRSPKPFSPNYVDTATGPSKSATDLSRSTSTYKPITPVKATSDTTVASANKNTANALFSPSSAVINTAPADIPVNAPGLNETPPSDGGQSRRDDEPASKQVPQMFSSRAEDVKTPRMRSMEPSKQPLSAKLANFEKKISENTPRSGLAHSAYVPKTPKQVCTPALSASTPAASSTTSAVKRPKDCDPSDLPVSQRMSQMQEKLSNTPQFTKRKDEPTAYSVGARMSAWETMTSSNLVSDIKKVNPGESTPAASKPRPVTGFTPKPVATPQNPPPPPAPKSAVGPAKCFRECIEEKASQVWARKESARTSPSKSAVPGVKSPVVHSPAKVSAGTKSVQQRLAETCQSSGTTCGNMAAQMRAARMAELEAIQNRWKNGVLREDNSSSDESTKPSEQTAASSDNKASVKEPEIPKTPGSSRREDARNKARADFNNKLAEIGLDGHETPANRNASTTPARPPPPASTTSANTGTPGKGQTASIYNLIKKREESATPNNEDNKKVKFNNSFDDTDDDCERKIPRSAAKRAAKQASIEKDEEEFKKPAAPVNREESESDVASSSEVGDEEFGPSHRLAMEIDDDDISLKGFVSEAVRRESILPPANRSSHSSLDSYEDDCRTEDSDYSEKLPSSSKRSGYRPEDESMDDEDNSESVDDLLDEAMDNTSDDYDPDMDPRNVQLRSRGQPRREEYDPDMDPNNVVMRRKPNGPVPASRSCNMALESTDDDEDSRPYSLQAYRKSAHIQQHMMEPIVRKSRYAAAHVQEEDIEMPNVQQPRRDDKRAVQERIKELQELVQQEQSVIMQTSNALNKCCMGNSYFAGSAEQVECNRLLLIACQKRQCYMTEIERLKGTGCLSHEGPGPQGSLTISDIRLPLKKDFVTKIGTHQDMTTHYFILLIRNGSQLICTQMLSTHDPMMRGSLDFPNLIKINGITGNFKLTLDIYSMSVSREHIGKDKKKKTPKKAKGYAMALESPGGPTAVRTTSFSLVSSLELTMKSLDKTSFHLERLPYLSPLYGQIFMRLKCMMEVNVEERGFLTMFEDVSGFGAWHRRWCVLSGNKLCVWKYPDDESKKDPMAIIDLKRCITEKVGLVPRDICARPNTFELVIVRQPLKGEHDTLVTRTYNSTTMVRHQMSADSKEERIVWCNKLNRTLANLRTWNADAVKPGRPAAGPSSSSRR